MVLVACWCDRVRRWNRCCAADKSSRQNNGAPLKRLGDGMELFALRVVTTTRVSEPGLVGFWDVRFVEKVWDIASGAKGTLTRPKSTCHPLRCGLFVSFWTPKKSYHYQSFICPSGSRTRNTRQHVRLSRDFGRGCLLFGLSRWFCRCSLLMAGS